MPRLINKGVLFNLAISIIIDTSGFANSKGADQDDHAARSLISTFAILVLESITKLSENSIF